MNSCFQWQQREAQIFDSLSCFLTQCCWFHEVQYKVLPSRAPGAMRPYKMFAPPKKLLWLAKITNVVQ